MSNYVLMRVENLADLSRPWTEVLTPQVVINWTHWSFHVYLNGRGKENRTSTNDMAMPCKKEKTRGLNFCKERKHEFRSTDVDLKSWTPDTNLAFKAAGRRVCHTLQI